jgi:hypothetical protein
MFGKMRIDQADRLFSLWIRHRDDWTCQRCQKKCLAGSASLQNSHYFGRTKLSVRFDPLNCDALCFGCHRIWEKEDREGYRVFKIRQLGQKGYDLLQIRANTIDKSIDRKLIAMYYKQELQKMGAKI